MARCFGGPKRGWYTANVMRRLAPKIFILAAVFYLTSLLVPGIISAADRRPYFKTFGADVMTGGWFNDGATCDTDIASKYQDGRNSVDHLTGGILGYANSSATNTSEGGASSEFAVFAMGLIEGNRSADFGFYSNSAQGGAVGGRTFANNAATPWGGYFQDDEFDGVRQSYCIPDYYSKKPPDADTTVIPATPAAGSFTSATASGIYRASAPGSPFYLNSGVVNLTVDKNITIFVDGDVFIGNNISFNQSDPAATATNIPKFALVARGSIYIGPGVTDLYGFYIAQPNPTNPLAVTDDDGIIWTCHPNDSSPLFYTWPIDNCNNRLVITGGLAAKQVNFMRVNGDVNAGGAGENNLIGAMGSANIAEIINYSPAIALDGPFFTSATSSSLRNKIDSVISLPPVF